MSQPEESTNNNRPPDSAVHTRPIVIAVFLLVAAVVLWAFWQIVSSFLTPAALAAVIVVFTFPLFRSLRTRLRGRENLAATLMILGLIVAVFLPAAILVAVLISQASDLVEILQKTDFRTMFESLGVEARLAAIVPKELMRNLDLGNGVLEIVRKLPGLVAAHGGQLLAGIANAVIGFLFMLFGMFFFYTEGEGLVAGLRSLSPLPDVYNTDVIRKFKEVIDATFRGHFLTAIAQGIATGIGLAITGIPGAVFWSAVATIFSLVPLFGAAIVWVPATGYLTILAILGKGTWVPPIVLGLWGAVVVSLVDNVIRPWAMKGAGGSSAVVLLISVLGGIRAFGFLGIILGPLVFALLVTVIDLYKALLLGSKDPDSAAPVGFV